MPARARATSASVRLSSTSRSSTGTESLPEGLQACGSGVLAKIDAEVDGLALEFGVDIGDDFLRGGNRLLDRGDLVQLRRVDGVSVLAKRENHLAAHFLQPDQRQPVVRQRHHGPSPSVLV